MNVWSVVWAAPGVIVGAVVAWSVVRGRALILNLPGQPKAIKETLEGVFPAVPYCIDLIGGPYVGTGEDLCQWRQAHAQIDAAMRKLGNRTHFGSPALLKSRSCATKTLMLLPGRTLSVGTRFVGGVANCVAAFAPLP